MYIIYKICNKPSLVVYYKSSLIDLLDMLSSINTMINIDYSD